MEDLILKSALFIGGAFIGFGAAYFRPGVVVEWVRRLKTKQGKN